MATVTLKAARVNVGLTQKEAAKKLNISNKTLSKWENGTSSPREIYIDPICSLYKTDYNSIIFLK